MDLCDLMGLDPQDYNKELEAEDPTFSDEEGSSASVGDENPPF